VSYYLADYLYIQRLRLFSLPKLSMAIFHRWKQHQVKNLEISAVINPFLNFIPNASIAIDNCDILGTFIYKVECKTPRKKVMRQCHLDLIPPHRYLIKNQLLNYLHRHRQATAIGNCICYRPAVFPIFASRSHPPPLRISYSCTSL